MFNPLSNKTCHQILSSITCLLPLNLRTLDETPQIDQVQANRDDGDECFEVESQHIDHEKESPNKDRKYHGPPEK